MVECADPVRKNWYHDLPLLFVPLQRHVDHSCLASRKPLAHRCLASGGLAALHCKMLKIRMHRRSKECSVGIACIQLAMQTLNLDLVATLVNSYHVSLQ